MNGAPLPRAFAVWLDGTGMTGAEKAECLRLARKGFAQGADLLLLGEPGGEERLLLRALGAQRPRSGEPQPLGNWQLWRCPAGRGQRECLTRFLQTGGGPERKKLVILFAAPGRGGRLRAQRVWRRACGGKATPLERFPALAIQAGRPSQPKLCRFGRQENSEWLLQQAAAGCLGRQVQVLTVSAGRRAGCGREQLWYQLAKSIV